MGRFSDAKAFIDKINPFAEKVPEITDNLGKLAEDEEFKKLIGNAGTIGALFNIGIYVFDKLAKNVKDNEKSYYALINKTTLLVTQEIIKENELEIGEKKVAEIIKDLVKIYKKQEEKASDLKRMWNSFPYDHPIIIEFRQSIITLLNEYHLIRTYQNFAIIFNKRFSTTMESNEKFKEYQIQQNIRNIEGSREKYFKWVIEEIDKPNPVDGKRVTDYYIENKVIELDLDNTINKDYWNISEGELYKLFDKANYFDLIGFLNSEVPVKYIAAPLGTGKTSFILNLVKDIAKSYILGEQTWIPIYIPLKNKLSNVYKDGIDLPHLLKKIIKPKDEKIILICDGLDECPKNIISLNAELSNLDSTISSSLSISELKIIYTTRPEAGIPADLGIRKYTRLLPFNENQVSQFFQNYGYPHITYDIVKRYSLGKEEEEEEDLSYYTIDFVKPLFCWMFAISHKNINLEQKNIENNVAKVFLYSSFIHSILEGRYYESNADKINYEKWLLRKIAALKAIYKDKLTINTIREKIDIFLQEEGNDLLLQYIRSKQNKEANARDEDIIHTIITSYFRFSESSSQYVDFLHKSFQEYLLAEYYLECIVNDKWHRLNLLRHPNDITIQLLESLIQIINLPKQEYKKVIDKIHNSLIYKDSIKATDLSQLLISRSKSILERRRIIIFSEKIQNNKLSLDAKELWAFTDLDLTSYTQSLSYLTIPLFILKKLAATEGEKISNFKEILENINLRIIPSRLKYFPKVDISGANLIGVYLNKSDLTGADLSGANLNRASLVRSSLVRANLSKTNLGGANLGGANLTAANLNNAILTAANLSNANLTAANLSNAIFYGANLSRIILLGINHYNDIKVNSYSNFNGAIIDNPDFLYYIKKIIPNINLKIYNTKQEIEIELKNRGYDIDKIHNILIFSNLPEK